MLTFFTNAYNVNDVLLQVMLTTDMSYHYAIFRTWNKHCLDSDQYQLIRLYNEYRMASYKENISVDWTALDQYVKYILHNF